MAYSTMALLNDALKNYYLDAIVYQLNEESSDFLARVERDATHFNGSKAVMALRYGRTGGISNITETGDLPTPNPRKVKQIEFDTKNIAARIQVSDKAVLASRGKLGAFIPILESDLEAAETDAKWHLGRQAWGDGTGVLATVSAVSGNVLTVGTDVIHLFAEGMFLDSYTQAGVAHASGMEVTYVDDEAGTITVDAAGTTAVNDYLYNKGSKDLELTGIKGVLNNPVLYGLTRSQYSFLNVTQLAINGEISEPAIQKAIDTARKKVGAKIDYLACSDGVRRAYQALLMAQKQIVNTIELKGGGTGITFNGLPLAPDIFAPKGELWCLSLDDWKMYQLADWRWLNEDGDILTRVPNKPVWEATLIKYCDLGCSRLRGQVRCYGITEH